MPASSPIIVQLFDSFLGAQEGIHSVILPDVFSSGGSKNLWIDKYGRAKRILGYVAQNGTPVTTDTGASATRCRALFPYRKTSGGSTTRQTIGVFDDAVNELELWYSTNDGANWTFIADLGSTVINQIPDFAQFGDTLIITSGKVAPRSWDGTTLTTAGGDQSPTPTAAAGTSGNLTGNYKWKLVSIVAATGARDPGSVASNSLALQGSRASLTWTADADTAIGGYELYRTSGTGEVFYFVTYIDGRATAAYTDNSSDVEIIENRILEEHGDAPPTTYFCEAHGQRMWYFRTDSEPQRGYFSDPGDPDSVWTENYIEFKDAETQGDIIVGAKGDYEGTMVVFQERSIWTVSGTGQIVGNINDWTRTRTNAQVGAVHHRAVARVPAGSKFADQLGQIQTTDVNTLAYLTPFGDVRIFDGDNDIIVSHPKKEQLADLNHEQRHKCWAVGDPKRGEITWGFPSGSSGEVDSAITWNYRWGVWYEREWPFACVIEQDSSTTTSILLAGSASTTTGGYVYQLWSGNSFNGAGFTAQWMTKTLYGVNEKGQPAISHRKRWRWGDFMFETEQNVTLTLEWLEGNSPDNAAAIGSATFAPASSGILTADGDTLVTADGDPIVVAEASTLARVKLFANNQYLHNRGIRLRIYDSGDDGSWSLESFNLAYQILEGLRRQPGAV